MNDDNIDHNRQAVALAQEGNPVEAIRLLHKVLERDPGHLDALNNLGMLYWQENNAEMAFHLFHSAYQAAPTHRLSLMNLGCLCQAVGKLEEARALFQRYLAIDPLDQEFGERLAKAEGQIAARNAFQVLSDSWQEFLSLVANGRKVNLVHFYRCDTGELAGRIGELALGYDLFLRLRQLGRIPADETYVFFSGPPANLQLQKMYKRELNIVESAPLLDKMRSVGPVLYFNQVLDRLSAEFDIYRQTTATLRFTPEEEELGQLLLQEMGIGKDDWFVCIFARDPRYIELNYPGVDHSHSNFRDADINSYHLASEEIAKAGGFVLRVGSTPAKPLQFSHPRLIDYAGKYRSDFMDIYLMGHCRFCLGTPSGICEVTYLFDKPFLAVNLVPYGYAPYGKNCLFLPKKVRSAATGQYVAFSKFLAEHCDRNDPGLFNGTDQLARGYRYEDNSPEEIREVTIEMLQRLDSTFHPSAADQELQAAYHDLIPSHHWNAHNRTPIGTSFLKCYSSTIFRRP